MTWPFVLALPWLYVLAVLLPLTFLRRPRLGRFSPPAGEEPPLVSIIVPARDEAENIGACLATLIASAYPRREVVVLDDRSGDSTAIIARALAEHSPVPMEVIEGAPLPPGWMGKPWACWQAFQHARGELLLFTDADTRHDDSLLSRAVAALEAEHAGLVTVLPRQATIGFAERLVMPHVLVVIGLRYHDLGRVNRTRKPRDVIANGQFLLFRRDAYLAIGGHEGVRDEVVEDLRLAQRLVASGGRLFAAHAEELMETRMYRSMDGLVEGWSKNLAAGARYAVDPWLRPVIPWLVALALLVYWVVPPVLLVAALAGVARAGTLPWALVATAASLVFWIGTLLRMRVPARYALLYPLGGAITAALFVRSARLGNRITWKGRAYGGSAARGADRS